MLNQLFLVCSLPSLTTLELEEERGSLKMPLSWMIHSLVKWFGNVKKVSLENNFELYQG